MKQHNRQNSHCAQPVDFSSILYHTRISCFYVELAQVNNLRNKLGGDTFLVDSELAHRHILAQVVFMHTAKRAQKIAHACPHTFLQLC